MGHVCSFFPVAGHSSARLQQHRPFLSARNLPDRKPQVELLNVSYDPTRELYKEFNEAFAKHWEQTAGQTVKIKMSHGGSGGQARKVIEGRGGLGRDLGPGLRHRRDPQKANLLPGDWQQRLPNHSSPYTSTIVFVVREGNPKGIRDWDDLLKPGVSVITPHPKTSGGARWNYLAAWGYALRRELGDLKKLHDAKEAKAVAKAQEKAKRFVAELYKRVPVLDSGARGSTITFAKQKRGDVLLAWENDAYWSQREFADAKLEIVAPSVSILAEPPVAVIDKVVDEQKTRDVAEAYLKYLYSPEGQTIIAKNYFRPIDAKKTPAPWEKPVTLFTVDEAFGGWQTAKRNTSTTAGRWIRL